MEYESSKERLPVNVNQKSNGNGIDPLVRNKIIDMLKQGAGITHIQRQTGISKHTIIAIRNAAQDAGMFPHGSWKKHTAETFSEIVSRGADRLLNEIDDLPVGQLPVALAIMTDKVLTLQDAPTIVVEHRLRVSHDDINAMLKGEIIDVNPKQEIHLTDGDTTV